LGQEAWNEEAALRKRAPENKPSDKKMIAKEPFDPKNRKFPPRHQTPSKDVCLKFLTRNKSPESRKRIEALLSAKEYSSTGGGPEDDIVEFRGYSEQRARGDRLLGEFDGKLGSPRSRLEVGKSFHLGGVKGVVELPAVPRDGSLVIAMVPSAAGSGWWAKVPVERLTADFKELAESMKRIMDKSGFTMPSRFGFDFRDIVPGEYQVKVLWRKKAGVRDPAEDITPESGDLFGESSILTVVAGLVAEPELFKCEQPAAR